MILLRSTGRVTVLAVVLLFTVAVGGLRADDGDEGLDRDVVVVGEDQVVLHPPEPAGWARVALPDLDIRLPPVGPDSPLVPPIPPWSAPRPFQVIALLEVPDV
jgi:hypothetical protein